jgi:hypothetical protein
MTEADMDGFAFREVVPGLTETTGERFSEADTRPDIAGWANQRAADLVRHMLDEANAVLSMRAGDPVIWRSGSLSDVRRGSRGVLLGFRGRQLLVEFGPECLYADIYGRDKGARWTSIVDTNCVRPAD